MCSRIRQDKRLISPGQLLLFTRPLTATNGEGVWEGFARLERIKDWQANWHMVEIPVEDYAERNHQTNKQVWAASGVGYIMGLELNNHVRVVTKKASLEQFKFFGHDRVPLFHETLSYLDSPVRVPNG